MKMEIVFKDGRKEVLDNVKSFSVTEGQNVKKELNEYELVQKPTEGKLFKVNPLMDRNLFEKPRQNKEQEKLRLIIQEAFKEVDKYPGEYSQIFYTLIPEKKDDKSKKVMEFYQYARDLGGKMANWVQQVLEWAQRINNGENWNFICKYDDTSNYYRMVIWKDGYPHIVGGSIYDQGQFAPSDVDENACEMNVDVTGTVPLVVIKKEEF